MVPRKPPSRISRNSTLLSWMARSDPDTAAAIDHALAASHKRVRSKVKAAPTRGAICDTHTADCG